MAAAEIFTHVGMELGAGVELGIGNRADVSAAQVYTHVGVELGVAGEARA
jgi:hypothetical protein